ncbi:MAG: aminopeptidase P family N-terminal domain-containing protein [Chloroflexi bacterium]|nr:aminopeptidase P family N-terminal domain-containing protein [Chloroflexota bacterium]
MNIELAEFQLPDYGLPTVEPDVPADEYEVRLATVRSRMKQARLDALVIYGDREHFANLAYLTGYDPRFEEALCVVTRSGKPSLLVGNEGVGYAGLAPLAVNVVLHQSFSLLNQPRDRLVPLKRILRDAGITPGMRVGAVGWKYFSGSEAPHSKRASELPAWVLDAVKSAVPAGKVRNATALFMASDGVRAANSVHQLARFEFAGTVAGQMVRDAIFQLRPGLSEYDAVRQMRWPGMPLSCHLMLTAGERARVGLASPSSRPMQTGEPFTTAVGLWGALTARAGFLVEDASQLPLPIRDYFDRLVKPYFAAAATWYETIGIGVTGGELHAAVHAIIGDPFYGVALNPGHLIHLDEWLSSPVERGSTTPFVSGMAVQCDIIPATGTAYFTSNIEDGVALGDSTLRRQFARQYPEAWARICARRAFMQEALGIRLKPEVLPLSNLSGYLPPFLLAPGRAMRRVA